MRGGFIAEGYTVHLCLDFPSLIRFCIHAVPVPDYCREQIESQLNYWRGC
jgi:hypothetical protein